jgi:Protein of unknown function (DUF1566)
MPMSCKWVVLAAAAVSCASSQGGTPSSPDDGGPEATSLDEADVDATLPDSAAGDSDGTGLQAEASFLDSPSCPGGDEGSRWANWPMPDPTGADPRTRPSYDEGSPDVVVDNVTHLMWERRVDGPSSTWEEAKQRCACLVLGGHDDWHLAMRIELVSIVDFTRHDPAVDPEAFPATPSEYFWTSSPLAGSASSAWYLFFLDGNAHSNGVDNRYRSRCVRGGVPAPSERYMVPGDGTVVDVATGLVWQASIDAVPRTFADSVTYCTTLPLAGGGFRLPSMKELQTLIDEQVVDPAIDSQVFPATTGESFWSGSPLVGGPPEAWFVNFYSGVSYSNVLGDKYLARCVRALGGPPG